jgi:hypothetical protein
LPDSLLRKQRRANAVPSPGGEGQDEGELKTNFIFKELQKRAPRPLPNYTRPMKPVIEKKS